MLVGGPFGLGPAELVIVFLILVMLFGASKLADLGGALGKGIREFRKAAKEEEEKAPLPPPQAAIEPTISGTPITPASGVMCSNPTCRASIPSGARFCPACGTPVSTPATPTS